MALGGKNGAWGLKELFFSFAYVLYVFFLLFGVFGFFFHGHLWVFVGVCRLGMDFELFGLEMFWMVSGVWFGLAAGICNE